MKSSLGMGQCVCLGERWSQSQEYSPFRGLLSLEPNASQATAALDPGDGRSSVILRRVSLLGF